MTPESHDRTDQADPPALAAQPRTTAQMLDELDGYAEKLGATAVAYAKTLRLSAPNDDILASIVSGFRQQAAAIESIDGLREVVRGVIREALDDSALTHTARSIGDIASGRVADDVLAALDERHFEIVYVGPGDMP